MEFFDSIRGPLDDSLPQWWAHREPTSELNYLLQAIAESSDELAAAMEDVYADQALSTATDSGLRTEYAVLYGAASESLTAMTTEQLRSYLQARAAEDGSRTSLESTLLGMLHNDANDVAQATLTLDTTFPASGGITLWQASPDRAYLQFASDGSGLALTATFPASNGRVEVIERFADSRIDVNVRSYLAFDRAAFARAVARFRQAHHFASVITETSS